MTLRVPTKKAKTAGLRSLAADDVVTKALTTLKGRARVKRTMWSRRAQEYEAKINSGDLISIAEVVRDLHRADNQPEQSYSERQLYESALDRMAREVAAIERIDRDAAVGHADQVADQGGLISDRTGMWSAPVETPGRFSLGGRKRSNWPHRCARYPGPPRKRRIAVLGVHTGPTRTDGVTMRLLTAALAAALLATAHPSAAQETAPAPASAAKPVLGPDQLGGTWSLDGLTEGAASCSFQLGVNETIGGWTVNFPPSCKRAFPIEAVTAWRVNPETGAIVFADAERNTIFEFERTADGAYVANPDGKPGMVYLPGGPG